MLLIGFLAILSGAYFLSLTLQTYTQWFLPGIFLFGIGVFVLIEKLSCWLEEKSIEYHSAPNKMGNSLYKIKKDTKHKFVISSTMSKSPYFLIPFISVGVFFILGLVYAYYYIEFHNNFYIFSSLIALSIGIFFWVTVNKLFHTKGEYIIFDKVKKNIKIKSPVQRETLNIPFKEIKRIIVRKSKTVKKQKISKFYGIVYQVIIELNNGKKRIFERTQDKVYIQNFVQKLRHTLKVEVIDLASLNLDTSGEKIIDNDCEDSFVWTQLIYNKSGDTESFSWKAKESSSSMVLELFFILLAFCSLFYTFHITSFPRISDISIILIGIILILIIIFIRNYFGSENFIFNEKGIVYQYKLYKWIIQEKSLRQEEIKNAFFLFDDAILEGKEKYLIGNISSLNPVEKKWLKQKWHQLLQLPASLELEQNLVRFS